MSLGTDENRSFTSRYVQIKYFGIYVILGLWSSLSVFSRAASQWKTLTLLSLSTFIVVRIIQDNYIVKKADNSPVWLGSLSREIPIFVLAGFAFETVFLAYHPWGHPLYRPFLVWSLLSVFVGISINHYYGLKDRSKIMETSIRDLAVIGGTGVSFWLYIDSEGGNVFWLPGVVASDRAIDFSFTSELPIFVFWFLVVLSSIIFCSVLWWRKRDKSLSNSGRDGNRILDKASLSHILYGVEACIIAAISTYLIIIYMDLRIDAFLLFSIIGLSIYAGWEPLEGWLFDRYSSSEPEDVLKYWDESAKNKLADAIISGVSFYITYLIFMYIISL